MMFRAYGMCGVRMFYMKPREKHKRLNTWENYYIHEYQTRGQLMDGQNTQEVNLLFQLA
jgi:hypothetical protein